MSDIFDTLITNRTGRTIYGAEDTNRVGLATTELAKRLSEKGYFTTVASKTDWKNGDIYYKELLQTYLDNVKKCKNNFLNDTEVPIPKDVYYWTNEDANNIEKCLKLLNELQNNMTQVLRYSGTFYSGSMDGLRGYCL